MVKRLFYTLFNIIAISFFACPHLALSQIASIQFINNSANVSATSLDVYIDSIKVAQGLNFRAATGFIKLSTVYPHTLYLAAAGSKNNRNALDSQKCNLAANGSAIIFIDGLDSPANYAPNPTGRSRALKMVEKDNVIQKTNPNIMFFFHNGVTDAGGMDFKINQQSLVGKDIYFADTLNTGSYITATPGDYILDASNIAGDTVFTTVDLNLSNYADSAVAIFTSGFLAPVANHNGAALGIFGAFPGGQVVQLPAFDTAYIQLINNSADTEAAFVDVYVNGVKKADNLSYPSATAYFPVQANKDVLISVVKNGYTLADSFFSKKYRFYPTNRALALIGLITPSVYSPNPDGISTAFNIAVLPGYKTSPNTGYFTFYMFDGITDLGKFDVKTSINFSSDSIYASGMEYTSYINTLSEIMVTGGNTNILEFSLWQGGNDIYNFPLAVTNKFLDSFAILMLSGFKDSTLNEQYSPVLLTVFPSGIVNTSQSTSIGESPMTDKFNLSVFPNPTGPGMENIIYSGTKPGRKNIRIFDMEGQLILNFETGYESQGAHDFTFDASGYKSGLYLIKMQGVEGVFTAKMVME